MTIKNSIESSEFMNDGTSFAFQLYFPSRFVTRSLFAESIRRSSLDLINYRKNSIESSDLSHVHVHRASTKRSVKVYLPNSKIEFRLNKLSQKFHRIVCTDDGAFFASTLPTVSRFHQQTKLIYRIERFEDGRHGLDLIN